MPWKKKVIDLEWKNLRVCTINSLSNFITGEKNKEIYCGGNTFSARFEN